MELLDSYVTKDGERIILRDMDDYHLKNSFNYFFRKREEIRKRITAIREVFTRYAMMGLSEDVIKETMGRQVDEARSLERKEEFFSLIVESIGREAYRRGRQVPCANCNGTGKINDKCICLFCCGTGWILGAGAMKGAISGAE